MTAGFLCHQFPKNLTALSAAAAFLASLPQFADQTDGLLPSLSGQIARKHYVFGSDEGRVVGYAGWGLCAPQVADAYLAGTHEPTHEECLAGEIVVVMTFGARSATATLRIVRDLRRRYPGRRYVSRRIRGWGLQTTGGRL